MCPGEQSMNDMEYLVTFRGDIVDNASIDDVKVKLAALFRTETSKIESLFSGQRRVVKRSTSLETCEKIQKAFRSAGAICFIETKGDSRLGETETRRQAVYRPKPPPVTAEPMQHAGETTAMYGTVGVQIRSPGFDEKSCQSCGGIIKARAEICPRCGVRQRAALDKTVLLLLTLFLGGIGVHKYYLGKYFQGIGYTVFCWTGIPFLISLIEFVLFALKSSDELQKRYEAKGSTAIVAVVSIGGFVFLVAVLGIVAAIFVPNYVLYVKKGYQSRVSSELDRLRSAQEAYFEVNHRYAGSLDELGFSLSSPDVRVEIISADERCFEVVGTHTKLTKDTWLDCKGVREQTGPDETVIPADQRGIAATDTKRVETERQLVEGEVLRDLDYGFELKRPSAEWTFLKEGEIKKINPDASVGLYHTKRRIFSIVIAEDAPNLTLEDFASLTMQNLAVENRNLVYEREIAHSSGRAIQGRITGEIDGMKFTYLITVFKNEGFCYQVISWWNTEMAKNAANEVDPVHRNFGFIHGVKPKVRRVKGLSKLSGIGWTVDNGVYKNGIYGFRYDLPEAGWRFMDNVELKNINPDGMLGLVHEQAGIYAVVLAEKLGAMTPVQYERIITDNFAQTNKVEARKHGNITISGSEVALHIFENVSMENVNWDYSIATTTHDDFGCEIAAWWYSSKRDEALDRIEELHSGFLWLGAQDREKLRSGLLAEADDLRSIAPGECFRNYTYRNFPFGLIITVPKGFWSHLMGTEVRQQNEDASLMLQGLEYGLNAVLVLEASEDYGAGEYHKLILDNFSPPRNVTTREISSNGPVLLSTRFPADLEQEYIYHLVTASANGKHMQFLMYGLEQNLKDTQELETRILKGIDFTGAPRPEAHESPDGSYVNDRFGYVITPPDSRWKLKDVTPEPVRSLGSLTMIERSGKRISCTGGAIHAQVDIEAFMQNIITRTEEFEKSNLKQVSRRPTKWCGQDALLTRYEGRRGFKTVSVEVMTAMVGGTFYCWFTAGHGKGISAEDLRNCFKLGS
jgi:TM2 domain-containing membrane protein YozV